MKSPTPMHSQTSPRSWMCTDVRSSARLLLCQSWTTRGSSFLTQLDRKWKSLQIQTPCCFEIFCDLPENSGITKHFLNLDIKRTTLNKAFCLQMKVNWTCAVMKRRLIGRLIFVFQSCVSRSWWSIWLPRESRDPLRPSMGTLWGGLGGEVVLWLM